MKKEYIVELTEKEADEFMDEHWVGELVRCKNCKNWIPGYITGQDVFIPPKCGKYHQMVGHSSDDFCSLAEMR